MKNLRNDYLESAKEFAKVAMNSKISPIVIQNAHKAVEFALSVYAIDKRIELPRDHWQSKNLTYKISRDFGVKFGKLLRLYLGAYRLENGKRAEIAKELMISMLRELEKYVGESFISK